MKRAISQNLSSATKAAISSFVLLAATAVTPSYAEGNVQHDSAMEARIAALEAKLGRLTSLEEENRQLRSRLVKTEARSEAALRVSEKSLATKQVAPKQSFAASAITQVADVPKTTLWEGAYAGINAGYGLNQLRNYTNETTVDKTTGSIESINNSYDTSYIGGAVAGGQFGYNHVFANHIMLGGEADINWADVYNNANPTNTGSFGVEVASQPPINAPPLPPFPGYSELASNYDTNYRRVGMDWVGTVRARLGYDMGRFLPYVTGGLAYGGLQSNINTYSYGKEVRVGTNSALQPTVTLTPTGSYSLGNAGVVNIGWAAGAGTEYMVTDSWSIKGEYLYTSIGGVTTPMVSANIEPSDTKTYTTENTGSFGVHQARIGLNYHPGWSFTEPVLAAKF
jgi:outer membrane immunogenic protein